MFFFFFFFNDTATTEIYTLSLHDALPIPLPVLNSLFDPLYPPGMPQYWRADFIEEFTDEAIAKYAEVGPSYTVPMTQIHLYAIDGAASRVPSDATAWEYRTARWAS